MTVQDQFSSGLSGQEALDKKKKKSFVDFVARELANVAHGVARSGRGQSMSKLMDRLARSIEGCLGECNAQELANTAWVNKSSLEVMSSFSQCALAPQSGLPFTWNAWGRDEGLTSRVFTQAEQQQVGRGP